MFFLYYNIIVCLQTFISFIFYCFILYPPALCKMFNVDQTHVHNTHIDVAANTKKNSNDLYTSTVQQQYTQNFIIIIILQESKFIITAFYSHHEKHKNKSNYITLALNVEKCSIIYYVYDYRYLYVYVYTHFCYCKQAKQQQITIIQYYTIQSARIQERNLWTCANTIKGVVGSERTLQNKATFITGTLGTRQSVLFIMD